MAAGLHYPDRRAHAPPNDSRYAARATNGGLVSHAAKKKHKKRRPTNVLVHCAASVVQCKAPTGQVGPIGPTGPPGSPGGTGSQGPAGRTGPAGTGRAWGLVARNGTLTRSANAKVSKFDIGDYCITPGPGIDPTTTIPIVSPDASNDDTVATGKYSTQAVAEEESGAPNCPGGFEVVTLERTETIDSATGDLQHVALTYTDEGFSFVIP